MSGTIASPASPSTLRPLVLALLAGSLGFGLAKTYIPRLSDHRGYFLVPVEDRVTVPARARPRRTTVVVIDGLRQDAALGMASVRRLAAAGRCLPMQVGVPSVSRPVYAVLSTGLEQERTGSRNNDTSGVMSAESIWQVAREAGLRVAGRGELDWWRQLFPGGFDRFEVVREEDDAFAAPIDADLALVHPVYVDEAAHQHGAAAPEYARAVERADRELGRLLARTDLASELLIVTADHGHRARGGHGGPQPDVSEVALCLAGPGVRRGAPFTLDARSFAPSLALLLGLRFPRHLRAVEDDLDQALALVDEQAVGADYLAARRRAVDAVRAQNRAALGALSVDSWSALAARHARRQWLILGAGVALAAFLVVRRARDRRSIALVLGTLAAMFLVYALLAGGFDATTLNRRAFFLRNTFGASSVLLAAVIALASRRRHLVDDLGSLVGVLVVVNLAHVAAYGWPLGYPLPPPLLYFAPFLTSTFLVTASGALAVAVLVRRLRELRGMR